MATARTIALYDSDGVPITLSVHAGSDYELGNRAQLHGRSPHRILSRRRGRIPGEVKDGYQVQAKRFAVPVMVNGSTEQDVDSLLGNLGARLSPTLDHRIVYTRPDGTVREISATYEGGGDAITVEHRDKRHIVVPLRFKAHFPYWREVGVDIASETHVFDDGLFSGANDIVVFNSGDIVETWPEWIITGHAENIEAVNLGSGLMWRITEVVPLGSTLRIDTDPRSFGIWLDDVELYQAADAYSRWWPLTSGLNYIVIRGNSDGADPIGSFTIRWRPLFETP